MRTNDKTPENTPSTTRSVTLSKDRFDAMEGILMAAGIITDEEWFTTGGVIFLTSQGAVRINPIATYGKDWKCDIETTPATELPFHGLEDLPPLWN